MTVANVAVAIVAIIALTKDSSESQQLKDRVKKLEQAGSTTRAEASPNTANSQNSDQTKPKDSSTIPSVAKPQKSK